MLEIGMITQLGFLLIIIGFACLSKPYEYAKDQANDERLEKKAFKRQQRRKKKVNGKNINQM